jgi:hypothetical protein
MICIKIPSTLVILICKNEVLSKRIRYIIISLNSKRNLCSGLSYARDRSLQLLKLAVL